MLSGFNKLHCKYFVVQNFDIDFDLTAVFNFKNSPTSSSDLNRLKTFENINITKFLKRFQYDEFKARLKFIKSVWLKFFNIINNKVIKNNRIFNWKTQTQYIWFMSFIIFSIFLFNRPSFRGVFFKGSNFVSTTILNMRLNWIIITEIVQIL